MSHADCDTFARSQYTHRSGNTLPHWERNSKLIERADQGTVSTDLSTRKRATFRPRKTRRK